MCILDIKLQYIATMERSFKCQLCSATDHLKLSLTDYHRLFHAYKADFRVICGIDGCQRCFKHAGKYQNHAYTVHKQCTFVSNSNEGHSTVEDKSISICTMTVDEASDETDISQPVDDKQPTTPPSLHYSSALFLLGLKEKFKLSQVAMQGIIEGITTLSQHQNSKKLHV